MSAQRWLAVCVYRTNYTGDCTLGGVSGRVETLYVPHPRGNHEAPAVELQLLPQAKGLALNFVPVTLEHSGAWSMFGGNFVWTTDSRFRELYGDRPVAVHDRVERGT